MRGTAEQDEVRVGLIGYGLAGRFFHAPLIGAVSGLRVSAVVTGSPERGAAARAEVPGVALYETAAAMLDAAATDIVVVATPNRTHARLAATALEAGVGVVVDKPLATSAADARGLIARARERALLLTVFQNRRWDGDYLTLRRLLVEGALGVVQRFESRFERWRPAAKPGWRRRGEPEEAGGLLYDLGAHLIDQALQLFGPVEEVYAELERRRPGAEVDEDTFVALRHHSGVRSHLWMSELAAHAGPRLRVLGSEAAYVKHGLDVQEAKLRAGERPGDGWGEEPAEMWGTIGSAGDTRPVRTEPGCWQAFYRDVLACIRDGAPPPVDPADGAAVLEVIETARSHVARSG